LRVRFGLNIMPYLKAVITILSMWLIIRSNWLHELFAGSDAYNWLIGAIGTAAFAGAVLRILL
jgi:hypothetical protein